jgi:NTE family protein
MTENTRTNLIPMTRPVPRGKRRVSLALQGGGSHGAFTWGVLDALLEDGRLEFDGVSGASAGAVNAVALAQGFARAQAEGGDAAAGREAARVALRRVWQGVAGIGGVGAIAQHFSRLLMGGASGERLRAQWGMDAGGPRMSPYQTNPLDINPLRTLLAEEIDFKALAALDRPKVFVSATHAGTGRAEIFSGERLTLPAVMASTCLPMLFQAVEIDGEAYWDGGYSANPALLPLITDCQSRDIVLVQLNPLTHDEVPHTQRDIALRVSELAFNASLLSQMRALHAVERMLADGQLREGTRYQPTLMHRIEIDEAAQPLPAGSQMSTDAALLERLFERGRAAGQDWLERHFSALGKRSTIDVEQDYVASVLPLPTPDNKGRKRA